jgi:hypothetical protein
MLDGEKLHSSTYMLQLYKGITAVEKGAEDNSHKSACENVSQIYNPSHIFAAVVHGNAQSPEQSQL